MPRPDYNCGRIGRAGSAELAMFVAEYAGWRSCTRDWNPLRKDQGRECYESSRSDAVGHASLAASGLPRRGDLGRRRRPGPDPAGVRRRRNRMVDQEIVAAGVKNPRVIQAMRNTPRHEFVPRPRAPPATPTSTWPCRSATGQTISPPFIVAYMTEQLDPQPTDKVLEIGTGSGYQAAVLSPLVKEVYTIEIVEPLGHRAAKDLKRLKYDNVHAKVGDGYQGWPEHAPFDKIIVTCSPENVPPAAGRAAQAKADG